MPARFVRRVAKRAVGGRVKHAVARFKSRRARDGPYGGDMRIPGISAGVRSLRPRADGFENFSKPGPYPPTKYVQLQWCRSTTLVNGAVNVFGTEDIVRLNSLNDPSFSSLDNHRPYGWTQLLADGYNRYKVFRVDVELQAQNSNANANVLGVMFQSPEDGGTMTAFSVPTVSERPNAAIIAIGNNPTVVRKKYSIHIADVAGITRLQHSADLDQFCSDINSSPLKVCWLRLASGNVNSDVGQMNVTMKITQHVQLWGRVALAGS